MRYDEVEGCQRQFKRLTGVKRETFQLMLSVLKQSEQDKKRAGRPSKLSLADQLLLTLMYWREYRTQFHIAKSYGIHEANANRIIAKSKAHWPPRVSSSCLANEPYAPMKALRSRL
jgi:hypothetical protein